MADDFFKRFSVIGITQPQAITCHEESEKITKYLESGSVDFFHIRKIETDIEYTRELVSQIPAEFHKRLILHSHYSLFDEFDFGGIHIKSEVKDKDGIWIRSRSCHSLNECRLDSENFTYSFLSPVFDSISKINYHSHFSLEDEELKETVGKFPIIALGGVKPKYFRNLFDAKFAGAALLGYLWSPLNSIEKKINSITEAQKVIENISKKRKSL